MTDRRAGLTALAIFFLFGAVMSGATAVALLTPGGPLEPLWRLNPAAREAFRPMGVGAVVLMATVCVACALSAVGLWRHRRWGIRLAIALLAVNVVGDAVNAIARGDPRTLIGVPIGVALIAYLWRTFRARAAGS